MNRRSAGKRRRPRRRPGHFSLLVLLATALLLWTRVASERYTARLTGLPPDALAGLTVVLDPGHGGEDPGATRGALTEAMLTYRTAATLARVLRAAGADVRFTVRSRTLEAAPDGPLEAPRDARFVLDDTPLRRRARNDPAGLYRRADISARVWERRRPRIAFVSLHYDAARNPLAHGGHVCFDRRGERPRLAQAIGTRLREAGLDGDRAQAIHPRELGVLNPERNPVPERVLVELATLSNPDDRTAIQEPGWRERIARLIARALADVFVTS